MSIKNVEDVYRLSPRQQDVLAATRAGAPGASVLHASLRGELSEPALARALDDLARREAVLRTAFFADGLKDPVQVVRERIEPLLLWEDWSAVEAGEREARLRDRVEAEQRRAWSPTAAPLARLTALRLAPGRHDLVFTYHPLILDERSALRCLEDVCAGLGRSEPAEGERDAAFRDYIGWIERQDPRGAADFFGGLLHGTRGPTLLVPAPLGPVTGGAPGSWATQQIGLPADATGQIQTVLRQHRLDLGALLECAWALLLARASGEREVLFGAAVSGRPGSLARSEAAIGPFAGLLPRRVALPAPGATLLSWIDGQRAEGEALRRHAHASLGQIRAWAGCAPGDVLFESAVAEGGLLDDGPRRQRLRSLGVHAVVSRPAPAAALSVRAEQGTRLLLRFAYDARRFEAPRIARAAADLAALLEALARRPEGRLEELPPASPPCAPAPAGAGRGGFSAGDVEAVLLQHPGVRSATVTAEGEHGGLVAEVVPREPAGGAATRRLDFSLFYFADADAGGADKYRIYLAGARFADQHGFAAVWTPERHFHETGGLYPNPSVLSAALATITSRVKLRAGSVVVPLQNPLRVAEEWSVVDNLSGGRVGISVATGWVPNDFALAPAHYASRREVMLRGVEQIRALWAGDAIPAEDGTGRPVAVRVFPRPVQRELPMWLTAAGNPETFIKAGELGCNVLTSLLAQSMEDAAAKIALYREARARAGHDPAAGVVTMMVHTFVGEDAAEVLDTARGPFTAYLRSHVSLLETMVESLGLAVDIREPRWLDYLASFAFERYARQAALLGTPTSCLPLVERLSAIGIDELACLVDFGVDADAVIAGFTHLDELRRLVADEGLRRERILREYVAERLPELAAPITFRELAGAASPGGGSVG